MKARLPRSSAMRSMCCSARPATSPTTPPARLPARSQLDRLRRGLPRALGERGVALGVTRIGVHAGPAIVGNFGGGRFFDYTAYGDTINTAARLEARTRALGTRICVSAIVASAPRTFRAGRSAISCCAGERAAARLRAAAAAGVEAQHGSYAEAFAKLEAGDSRSDAGFRSACRPACRRSARRLSLEAAAQRRESTRMQLE